jgi:hypothetical protein
MPALGAKVVLASPMYKELLKRPFVPAKDILQIHLTNVSLFILLSRHTGVLSGRLNIMEMSLVFHWVQA